MSEKTSPPSREERLATQLRANLLRRKAQARAMAGSPLPDADALPKAEPSS